jgi:ATP-dependent RNA helicase DDX19/DBP5
MIADGHQVAHLSGALEGTDRDVVIDRFREGLAKVLITTNVIARGIDVSSVSLVVNYDIPELADGSADPETYLHRIGRTGRFGRVGAAVSFISDRSGWEKLMQISQHFGTHIEPLSGKTWDEVEDTLKKILKNPRSGKTTREMTQGAMETDGATS